MAKFKNTVVCVPTQKDWNIVVETCKSIGVDWNDTSKITMEDTKWNKYKENSIIEIDCDNVLVFGHKEYYECYESLCNIISVKEFLNKIKPKINIERKKIILGNLNKSLMEFSKTYGLSRTAWFRSRKQLIKDGLIEKYIPEGSRNIKFRKVKEESEGCFNCGFYSSKIKRCNNTKSEWYKQPFDMVSPEQACNNWTKIKSKIPDDFTVEEAKAKIGQKVEVKIGNILLEKGAVGIVYEAVDFGVLVEFNDAKREYYNKISYYKDLREIKRQSNFINLLPESWAGDHLSYRDKNIISTIHNLCENDLCTDYDSGNWKKLAEHYRTILARQDMMYKKLNVSGKSVKKRGEKQ